ncbi:MAG TPA: ABC transporter substrate-binding protein [Pseudolabrys sp.]|nr:ABC transporter substrate-binding protein [Pseudolabrys sp.]
MSKVILPRREFLAIAGSALAASAVPFSRAWAAEPINFGFQNTSWGTIGMICETEGLFKKANADVKVFTFDSGKTTRDAMISGRIGIGVLGATPFIIGAAKGQMEAIALALYGSKTLSVVAGTKSGIKSVKDLKGHRVGSQLGSTTDFVFQNKILPKAGLSKNDVQIVNVRFQNQVSALAAGSIDAFAGVEPFPSVAEVEGLGKVLTDYSDYDLQPVILAANTNVVKKQRDEVIAFLRGWLAGVKVFNQNRDKAVQIVLDHFKSQGFSVDARVIKLMLSKIDVSPEMKPQLQKYLTTESAILMKQHKIAASPDWDKLLNRSLLKAAEGKS